jgi:hypothetical protein
MGLFLLHRLVEFGGDAFGQIKIEDQNDYNL